MKPIRVGVVGLGGRGRHWIRMFERVSGAEVVAICDRNEVNLGRAKEVVTQPVQTYRDFDQMLKEAAIDAVGVATAPMQQAEVAIKALESGRHVMVEVPMSYDLDHCWDMLLAVEKSGLVFQMAEQVRYWGFIQAWRRMAEAGDLGEILFAQGEYVAPYGENAGYFVDTRTGEYVPPSQAKKNPNAVPFERFPRHPIAYSVHEMSPLLSIIKDRVDVVSCMATVTPSPTVPDAGRPDFQMAMMQTTRGALIREVVGFTNPLPPNAPHHWYHLIGTKGAVESPRSGRDEYKMWRDGRQMSDYASMPWGFANLDAPAEARGSGHGDADFYPFDSFVKAIRNGTQPPMDIYLSLEASVPGIVAGLSFESGGVPLRVPDFRPGSERSAKAEPTSRNPDLMQESPRNT